MTFKDAAYILYIFFDKTALKIAFFLYKIKLSLTAYKSVKIEGTVILYI